MAGELAVFCRPVVTAPAWSAGTGRCWRTRGCRTWCGWASWSAHLGDGVIEAAVDAAMAKGG